MRIVHPMKYAAFLFSMLCSTSFADEYLMIGLDQKVIFDKPGFSKFAPGNDQVVFYDISTNPDEPKLSGKLDLENSVFGPPTNLAINPEGSLALITNAVKWLPDGETFKHEPDNIVNIISLSDGKPGTPKKIEVGNQPSGICISVDGSMAAVANRKDGSITLLQIKGEDVSVTESIELGGQVAAVSFLPDLSGMVAVQFDQHSAVYIPMQNKRISGEAQTLTVGRWPYNIQVSPDGRFAITANNGNKGLPDGHTDTVSLIDLKASPPRVIDHITVGDAPEGLAISPKGNLAVVPLLQGSADMFKDTWFHNKKGGLAILSLDKNGAKLLETIETGQFPEGIAFNKAGTHFYVGNHMDKELTVFRVDGQKVTPGKTIKLDGYPASLRSQLP